MDPPDGTGVRSYAALGNAASAGFFAASRGTSLVKVNVAWDCHAKEQSKIKNRVYYVSTATLLRDVFGFDAFRPGQQEIVEAVVDGQNALAIMPTGGGKSLCFQLPALVRSGVTVVISPLIAGQVKRIEDEFARVSTA